MPHTTPLDLSSLSHYKRSITLPTTSRTPQVAKLLTRYHASTKHSEQAAVCLQLANHYFTTDLFRHALPYYAGSLSHTVQCTNQHDIFPVLTLLRRLGECHHQLQHFASAANAFNMALTLMARLCVGSSAMTKRHWTLKQELLLSLGNSYQDWCDGEEEKGYTAGRPLALKAKDAHYESLIVARRLCGIDKAAGGAVEGAEDAAVREKAMTNMQATVLARAYINLANTLTQLLHFENVEREARKRVAATSAHIDTTDSSSASSSSLDDSHNSSNLASTLSSLATLSLASPASGASLPSLAASLYSSALSLAVSHNLVEEEQRVYSNRSALWEEDGQWQQAEHDIKHELKQLTRSNNKRKHKTNKHSSTASSTTADVITEQAACRARLMIVAVKAGRWEHAVREAKEKKRLVMEGGADEEEVERAVEDEVLMEEIRLNVRRKQATQRLLEELEDDMDDDSSARKRRRIDQLAGQSAEDARISEHVRLLHRYIDVCLSLAERNVDCHTNYATALAAHQQSILLLTPTTSTTLQLAVHSYYLYTLTRYLPWLLPQQHTPSEVTQQLAAATSTLSTCRPLAVRAVERGVLALLECHLMEESGAECDVMWAVLTRAVEGLVGAETAGSGSGACGSGGMIVRGQLLREQWHVLDLMDEEEEEEDEMSQRSAGVADEAAGDESEAKKARRARRKVQRTLLKGQMEVGAAMGSTA